MQLEYLLSLSTSDAFEERVAAANALGPLIESDLAAQAIISLLCDAHDTAVGQAALESLLLRGDERAMLTLFEGLARADDDMADHLLHFLERDHWKEPTHSRLLGYARTALNHPNGLIRDGAAEILDELGGNA